jgi:hypothetical protein
LLTSTYDKLANKSAALDNTVILRDEKKFQLAKVKKNSELLKNY